jgi:hypothetical protein
MIKHEGKVTGTHSLGFAGPSTFSGKVKLKKTGNYEIIVYAFDPLTGNTGVDKANVEVN